MGVFVPSIERSPEMQGGYAARAMLLADTAGMRLRDTVNTFRVAVLGTIAFLAFLMVVIACVVAIWDVSDRAMNVVSIVLTALPTMVTALIVYLKIEGVGEEVKIGNAEAAQIAAIAARNAANAAAKIDAVHTDVLNGPMRENVKKAVREVEADPEVQQIRIENVAKGVQRDRHAKAQRETAEQGWAQLEARRIREQHKEDQS